MHGNAKGKAKKNTLNFRSEFTSKVINHVKLYRRGTPSVEVSIVLEYCQCGMFHWVNFAESNVLNDRPSVHIDVTGRKTKY